MQINLSLSYMDTARLKWHLNSSKPGHNKKQRGRSSPDAILYWDLAIFQNDSSFPINRDQFPLQKMDTLKGRL